MVSVVNSRGSAVEGKSISKGPMNLSRLRCSIVVVLFALNLAHAQQIKTGEDVLRAMHDRYANTWYKTLTFTQKSTTFNPDGTTKVETWYEALSVPAKLRIDIGPPSNGNGYLLVDGNVAIYRDGKQSASRHSVNMLLVLGFDVYGQAPEQTISVVKAEGYDLQKVHEETWEGEPMYVVGADKGDLKSKQFWVEKKRLLFVRLFEPAKDPTKSQEVRFEDYRELAGGWVAARVVVYDDDKKVFSEEYSNIDANPKLDAGVFDPEKFTTSHWERP
jgi:outer membrane lipoprotein-sorting protein